MVEVDELPLLELVAFCSQEKQALPGCPVAIDVLKNLLDLEGMKSEWFITLWCSLVVTASPVLLMF